MTKCIRQTKGKCEECVVIFVWDQLLGLVRDAYCPRCGRKLKRTCAQPSGYLWVTEAPKFSSFNVVRGLAPEERQS